MPQRSQRDGRRVSRHCDQLNIIKCAKADISTHLTRDLMTELNFKPAWRWNNSYTDDVLVVD
jgi:hypothetical protein